MKKFVSVLLTFMFVFTVWYNSGSSVHGSRDAKRATGNWIQFSDNGIFLSDEPTRDTMEIPIALQTLKKNRKVDPQYTRHSIYVPSNFKLFVPYKNLLRIERN